MRYAVINTANTLVYSTHEYTGADWATFKEAFETENPGQTLINLGASAFPAGQGWAQDTGGIYPLAPAGAPDVVPGIMLAIEALTESLQYSGTVTFKGEQFPRDHDTRGDVVLLATAAAGSTAMAAALLPLRVNSISMAEVTIDNAAEANDFALAMLSPTKAIYSAQADQIAAVQAMTTITQLIQYVDPR